MEQSREVYETATNQLGSFLELVSSRLTMNKSGSDLSTPLPPASLSPDKNISSVTRRTRSSSSGGRGGGRRSESESSNRRKSSLVTFSHRNQQQQYHVEDPSLSPSISGRSSSPSELDPRRRTSDKVKYSRDEGRKSDSSVISGLDNIASTDDGAYNDISILSSCTCNDDTCQPVQSQDELDNERKSSKARNTLKRITSFMRKDKSKNLSLVNSAGPASLKYSR